MKPTVSVVWLKRDLRLRDHKPLELAAATGFPVILMYCFEPSLIDDPHMSPRHWRFISDSLADMDTQLGCTAAVLSFNTEAKDAFSLLADTVNIKQVFSYEEIGLNVTFERDRRMKCWFRDHGIEWLESPYGAVTRGLVNRNNWESYWRDVMHHPTTDPNLNAIQWFNWQQSPLCEFYYQPDCCDSVTQMQRGGERRGWHVMRDFFIERGIHYHRHISMPHHARIACTRLSPYMAWGNLSVRQVYQYPIHRKQTLASHPQSAIWMRAINALLSRIHWRCHFIQKFESEQ